MNYAELWEENDTLVLQSFPFPLLHFLLLLHKQKREEEKKLQFPEMWRDPTIKLSF